MHNVSNVSVEYGTMASYFLPFIIWLFSEKRRDNARKNHLFIFVRRCWQSCSLRTVKYQRAEVQPVLSKVEKFETSLHLAALIWSSHTFFMIVVSSTSAWKMWLSSLQKVFHRHPCSLHRGTIPNTFKFVYFTLYYSLSSSNITEAKDLLFLKKRLEINCINRWEESWRDGISFWLLTRTVKYQRLEVQSLLSKVSSVCDSVA